MAGVGLVYASPIVQGWQYVRDTILATVLLVGYRIPPAVCFGVEVNACAPCVGNYASFTLAIGSTVMQVGIDCGPLVEPSIPGLRKWIA